MASSTQTPEIVRVSQKGQTTIPKALREKFGIDAPGEVFIYDEGERIIVEPVPSLEDLGGIHAAEEGGAGEILAKVRELKAEEKRREEERAARLRPAGEATDE